MNKRIVGLFSILTWGSLAFAHHPELVLDECWSTEISSTLSEIAKEPVDFIVLKGTPSSKPLSGSEVVGISEQPIELGQIEIMFVKRSSKGDKVEERLLFTCYYVEALWPNRQCFPDEIDVADFNKREREAVYFERSEKMHFLLDLSNRFQDEASSLGADGEKNLNLEMSMSRREICEELKEQSGAP